MNGIHKPYKVLVISHTFPPDGGIGGRRWAKFAKSLSAQGCNIEVLAAEMGGSDKSLWTHDVEGLSVYRFKTRFPRSLAINPDTFLQKLRYRLALFRTNIKSKGTPYDRAVFDKHTFLRSFSARILVFKPDAVIVTGPPFNLLWYVAQEVQNYPSIKFIADFRDPWMSGARYGYGLINESRRSYELKKEAAVLESFNLIFTAWPSICDDLAKRYPKYVDKVKILPHCWDIDDLPLRAVDDQNPTSHLIYGGSIYQGFESVLALLSKIALKRSWTIQIFSSKPVSGTESLINKSFQIHPAIPSAAFYKVLRTSKYALFLIPEDAKDGFPTKVLEYGACGRPLIAVGYSGSLSEMVIERGLGVFVHIDHIESELEEMLDSDIAIHPDKKWIGSHELHKVTAGLLEHIEKA